MYELSITILNTLYIVLVKPATEEFSRYVL